MKKKGVVNPANAPIVMIKGILKRKRNPKNKAVEGTIKKLS